MNLDELDQAFTGESVTTTEVLAALIVLAAGFLVAYVIGRIAEKRWGRPDRQTEQVAKIGARVLRWAIVIVALVWALNIIGLDLAWLTVIVLILFVVGAMAVRPLAENLAAGLLLAVRPAFSVGDEIEIGEFRGEVIEFTDRSTVLRLRDGRRVHLPNSEVLATTVTVYSTDQARRSELELAISEDADIDTAEAAILEALEQVDAVLDEPEPVVQARSLDEGVGLVVKIWHPSTIQSGNAAVDSAIRAVKKALKAADVPLAPSLEVRVETAS